MFGLRMLLFWSFEGIGVLFHHPFLYTCKVRLWAPYYFSKELKSIVTRWPDSQHLHLNCDSEVTTITQVMVLSLENRVDPSIWTGGAVIGACVCFITTVQIYDITISRQMFVPSWYMRIIISKKIMFYFNNSWCNPRVVCGPPSCM